MELVKITKENINLLDSAMDLIYDEWGSGFSTPKQVKLEKIRKILLEDKELPQIYLLINKYEVIGSFSILEHELKESDLSPWLACVVINRKYRGQGYGNILLNHIKKVIENNFNHIYLTTDMTGFYEKIGFELVEIINNNGKNNRLYIKSKNKNI